MVDTFAGGLFVAVDIMLQVVFVSALTLFIRYINVKDPEKMATLGTRDKDKQYKDTTQYVLDTTISKQAQIK